MTRLHTITPLLVPSSPLPPPSPFTPLSSPLPQIPSPPLPLPSPPLFLPSTAHRTDILEAEMPPRKRVCFTAPTHRFEVGESSTAAAARQTGHTLARRVDYRFIDTLDASIRASKGRVMTTVQEVNERVTDIVATQRQDPHEIYGIGGSYHNTRGSDHDTANSTRQVGWQRQKAGKMVTRAFRCIHALEARDLARPDDLEDTDSRSGRRRTMPTARECTYSDFLKCQPLNFKGTKGVVGLTQWFEKMEYVFHISNCTVACQIKFAICTLLGNALTWWNSHVKTIGHDAAYGMTWKTLKKMMTDKYCPRSEIKKFEIKIWNLKVKGIDVVSYT
ncbi:reverse transcriptase domain-containing protein [Tanacetum coccineum]